MHCIILYYTFASLFLFQFSKNWITINLCNCSLLWLYVIYPLTKWIWMVCIERGKVFCIGFKSWLLWMVTAKFTVSYMLNMLNTCCQQSQEFIYATPSCYILIIVLLTQLIWQKTISKKKANSNHQATGKLQEETQPFIEFWV